MELQPQDYNAQWKPSAVEKCRLLLESSCTSPRATSFWPTDTDANERRPLISIVLHVNFSIVLCVFHRGLTNMLWLCQRIHSWLLSHLKTVGKRLWSSKIDWTGLVYLWLTYQTESKIPARTCTFTWHTILLALCSLCS